jgi:O-antigen/teichoic acid export membrane protein
MSIVRNLVQNTGFSLAAELVNRASNVVLFVIVSRLLGAREAGIYTLAFSYTMITTRLTFWGLDQLLIRESSKAPAHVNKFFSNFLFLRLGLSGLAWCLLWGVTTFSLPQGSPETRFIVLLVALSVLPENVSNLSQAVFIARQRMSLLVWARTLVTVTRIIGGLAVLLLGGGLVELALVILGSSLIGMMLNLLITLTKFVKLTPELDLDFCVQYLRAAWPLILSGAFYVIDNRLDILVLSFFLSESEVGVYNAAVTVVYVLLLLPQAYQVAVFPAMSRLYAASRDGLGRLYTYSLKYMLLLALPVAVSLTFVPDAVANLFGPEFGPASPVLRIMAWVIPLLFANVPTARLLIAGDHQSVVARSLMIRLALGSLLSVTLALRYGYLGVAATRLISTFVMVALNYTFVYRHIHRGYERGTAFRFLLAASGMGTVLLLLRGLLPWAVLLGGTVYLFILFLSGAFSQDEKTMFKGLTTALTERIGSSLG